MLIHWDHVSLKGTKPLSSHMYTSTENVLKEPEICKEIPYCAHARIYNLGYLIIMTYNITHHFLSVCSWELVIFQQGIK